MLCSRSVDNSEWMRNGDFAPNRLEAQTDACIQIAARKRDMNPENTVGVLTMAGKKGCVCVFVCGDCSMPSLLR